jgi:hypothetical protein
MGILFFLYLSYILVSITQKTNSNENGVPIVFTCFVIGTYLLQIFVLSATTVYQHKKMKRRWGNTFDSVTTRIN